MGTMWAPVTPDQLRLYQWRIRSTTFGHTALQTRSEAVSRKERDELWLVLILRILSIVVAQALEASNTPNWIVFRRLEAIDIVEMEQAKNRCVSGGHC